MKLLPTEEKILVSNEDKLILTDHRIYMKDSILGQSFQITIFLEDISSLEVKYRSRILYLIFFILGIISGITVGIMQEGIELTAGLIGLGILSLILWWYSRTHLIVISSDGGSPMIFRLKGMKDQTINEFIYEVSLAKQKRIRNLNKI